MTTLSPSNGPEGLRGGADGAGMFASLRIRNYRLFASGQVVSLVGYWMQVVAQDWLVLGLSGGSPTALGVATALQFGPTVALSLWVACSPIVTTSAACCSPSSSGSGDVRWSWARSISAG